MDLNYKVSEGTKTAENVQSFRYDWEKKLLRFKDSLGNETIARDVTDLECIKHGDEPTASLNITAAFNGPQQERQGAERQSTERTGMQAQTGNVQAANAGQQG